MPGNKALPEMPRLGMRMILPAEYDVMTWLGRGPQENYADRKTGYPIGLYTATVWEQFHPYVRAQETGNKTDVRWVALRNKAGEGLLITGEEPLNVSAWNFPLEDIDYVAFNTERRHGGSIIVATLYAYIRCESQCYNLAGRMTGDDRILVSPYLDFFPPLAGRKRKLFSGIGVNAEQCGRSIQKIQALNDFAFFRTCREV